MNFTRVLGSWWAIVAVWALCIAWTLAGMPEAELTLALSILALTFTQLVLREQRADTERWDRKMDELIHAVPEADDAVAGD